MAENSDIWREIAELRGRLQAVALPFCQSEEEAEDLVSRTIERAIGNAAKYDAAKGNLFVWMRTILVNIALNDAKAREIRNTYPCDIDELANDESMATSATDEQILASSDEEAIKAAINRLAPEYKKTVIMHYMMDMPLKEIAKVLHRPIGTVKWRLSVAKDVLAGMLKKTLGRPGTWMLLLVGLITGCVATYMVMRLPPRKQSDPNGGVAYNTPKAHEITVHHAPKEVKIDGDLGEWTAPVFESACNPPYDRDYSASIRMMWDEKRLYIGGDIRTPDPMRNNSFQAREMIFAGGSVICRLAANSAVPYPLPKGSLSFSGRRWRGEPCIDDDIASFIILYSEQEAKPYVWLQWRCGGGKVPDHKRSAQVDCLCVFASHKDNRGYTFECAIEWEKVSMTPPKPGEIRANTWNIHFSDADGLACTGQIVENVFPEAETVLGPDRVAAIYHTHLWGKVIFADECSLSKGERK